MKSVTCTAPVNIALIKYWGKRNEELVLPLNGSISVTINQKELRAMTTVAVCSSFTKDRIWINAKEAPLNDRVRRVIKEIRRRTLKRPASKDEGGDSSEGKGHIHICSENNFPTAAGLASSAAGYACMVYGLAKLFRIPGEISDIARLGSGSASRSMHGGFVEWTVGSSSDGTDCLSHQLVSEDHWLELRILILVVKDTEKPVSSSAGMQTSVVTSSLLQHRVDHVLPQRLEDVKLAIINRDFDMLAEITMKDSNQLHSICLDTFPPISYLNDVSHQIISLVHAFNTHCGETKLAYTFDAGPNACLFVLKHNLARVMAVLSHLYKGDNCTQFVRGDEDISDSLDEVDVEMLESAKLSRNHGAVKYIISTKPGPGPTIIDDDEQSLLSPSGWPKHKI